MLISYDVEQSDKETAALFECHFNISEKKSSQL